MGIVMSMVIQNSFGFFFCVCLGFLDFGCCWRATAAVTVAVCVCFASFSGFLVHNNDNEKRRRIDLDPCLYRNDAIFDKHQCEICQMMENQPNDFFLFPCETIFALFPNEKDGKRWETEEIENLNSQIL